MIRSLEEVSLNAWPSIQTMLLDGWVLRFGNGYTRRANSVNPLYPSTEETVAKIRTCEQLYGVRGLRSVFKITPVSQPQGLDAVLATAGYQHEAATSVQLLDLNGRCDEIASDVVLYDDVTEEWFEAYCAMSDVSQQLHSVARQLLGLLVPPRRLALLRRGDQAIACGLGVLQGAFLGLFDIVVAEEARHQGHARRLVGSLLAWGEGEGAGTAYLQVMLANKPALSLYARLGFQESYQYWYRVKSVQST
jgi:GNAT superfamily N-acetyltransferase